MATARQSRLELLPSEIKLLILESLPYFETLESLEEASPSMKKIYGAFYTRVVTAVTLNELANRDVNIFSLADCSLVDVLAVKNSKCFLSTDLELALKSLKGQLKESQKKELLLDTDSCSVLREVRDLVRWNVCFAEDRVVSATYMEVRKADDYYWACKTGTYRAVYLGEELFKKDDLRWTMYMEYYDALAEMGLLKAQISA